MTFQLYDVVAHVKDSPPYNLYIVSDIYPDGSLFLESVDITFYRTGNPDNFFLVHRALGVETVKDDSSVLDWLDSLLVVKEY